MRKLVFITVLRWKEPSFELTKVTICRKETSNNRVTKAPNKMQ